MEPVTKADKARWAERIRDASAMRNIVPADERDRTLTENDAKVILEVSNEIKRLSGIMFGKKYTGLGYTLKDQSTKLRSVLLGRMPTNV